MVSKRQKDAMACPCPQKQAERQAAKQEILNQLDPNWPQICDMADAGQLPVVVVRPEGDVAWLRSLGWDGSAPLFGVPPSLPLFWPVDAESVGDLRGLGPHTKTRVILLLAYEDGAYMMRVELGEDRWCVGAMVRLPKPPYNPAGLAKEKQNIMDQAVNGLLYPNQEKLVNLGMEGKLAVAVMNPKGAGKRALKALGWNGRSKVFGVPKDKALQFLGKADAVTGPWITRERAYSMPVLLFTGKGTLLLNLVAGEDGINVEVEPGSLDKDAN